MEKPTQSANPQIYAKIYNQRILPGMKYGAQTWQPTSKTTRKQRLAQWAVKQIMCEITQEQETGYRDERTNSSRRYHSSNKDKEMDSE